MNMQGLHYDLDSLFPENPDYLKEEEVCFKDYSYIKGLYPSWLCLIAGIIEEYVDRYEFDGSEIYNEYPDKISVNNMAEDIFYLSGYGDDDTSGMISDIIKVMLCNEIYLRRRRHDRVCRNFKINERIY